MEVKSLEKRLEDFLENTSADRSSYGRDPDMSEKRIDLYVRWLDEIDSSIEKLASRLSEKELSCLLDGVEDVYPNRYFLLGTEYGNGHGIRPVLEIIRNVLKRYEALGNEENRLTYIRVLHRIYKGAREFVDPKYCYYGEEDKKVNEQANELNQKIDGNPSEILKIREKLMEEKFSQGEENE